MWLINSETLSLEEFGMTSIPRYAALSHTWDSGEISFRQMQGTHDRSEKGFNKIREACQLARAENIDYVWIDTCCIDKTSSAELSEVINSMFDLYRKSFACYAFLSDLSPATETEFGLGHCRWFTRGWTLQELIAPTAIRFYDSAWRFRGTRSDLCEMISNITHIDTTYLRNTSQIQDLLRITHAAVKLSWMANRHTTREEDIAYSLLGLFEINIPLLYGEGSNAFRRLQEEILRKYGDLSILIWKPADFELNTVGILAKSPSEFSWIREMKISIGVFVMPKECDLNARGLRLTTSLYMQSLFEDDSTPSPPYCRLILDTDCWAKVAEFPAGNQWRQPDPAFNPVTFGISLRKYGEASYCREVTNLADSLVLLNPHKLPSKCPTETAFFYIDREFVLPSYWTQFPLETPVRSYDDSVAQQIAIHFPKVRGLDIINMTQRGFWDVTKRMLLCTYYVGKAAMITIRPDPNIYDTSDIFVIIKPLTIFEPVEICVLDSKSSQAQHLTEHILQISDAAFLESSDLGLTFGLNQMVRTEDQKWNIDCYASREFVENISRRFKVLRVEFSFHPVEFSRSY
jgi:Heterokaryon incompatibility protein (HET)